MEGYEKCLRVINQVSKVIVGKDDVIRMIMTCMVAGGHCLLEDIPGVGKTTMAIAFSRAMSLEYSRMQFTPDVMPSDVTGFSIYRKDDNTFEYKKGAVMTNLFLADEINRTSARTQSALLEAMEERAVTVDGVRHSLPSPFIVMATENPVEFMGTHMLPESQVDRFMFRLSIGYPSVEDEIVMMKGRNISGVDDIIPVMNAEMLMNVQSEAMKVFVHDDIYTMIAKISEQTRKMAEIELGISPRGSMALLNAAKANAFLEGRDYVVPDDIKAVLMPVASHRIILSKAAQAENITVEKVLRAIMQIVVKEH